VSSAGGAACQEALGKAAARYVKKRATAERSCLDRLAKGKLSGNAAALCRGGLVGGAAVPPQDVRTAGKLAKARAKFHQGIETACAPADLAQLDACADTAADVATCVSAAYGAAARAATRLAYGSVTAISGSTDLACQRAVGKASVTYLTAVVKAMQRCLDAVSAGDLSGNAQELCLGSLGPAGVTPPTDSTTARKIESLGKAAV